MATEHRKRGFPEEWIARTYSGVSFAMFEHKEMFALYFQIVGLFFFFDTRCVMHHINTLTTCFFNFLSVPLEMALLPSLQESLPKC